MENLKNKNSPPREEKYLKLNWRAWEYITMLDNYDAGKFIKYVLQEKVWVKNEGHEELEESIFNWSKELQMVAMMWNEHLFDD